MKKVLCVLLIMSFLSVGCRRHVQISTVQEGSTFRISTKNEIVQQCPGNSVLCARTFGNNSIEVKNDKYETFYSTIPLRFRVNKLIWELLIFAPLLLLNLRDPYRFYEIDLEKRCIRSAFRKNGPWWEYYPTEEDMQKSKYRFRTVLE